MAYAAGQGVKDQQIMLMWMVAKLRVPIIQYPVL